MSKWRVTGTKAGELVTVVIEAADHNAAVRQASRSRIIVRDCVLLESRASKDYLS